MQFPYGMTLCLCVCQAVSNYRSGVLIKIWIRYTAGVCWQSRYVWHRIMHTIMEGKYLEACRIGSLAAVSTS
jgi:hypothetical protein